MKKTILLLTILAAACSGLQAQKKAKKLNFGNVTTELVRGSGTILNNKDIKGYFVLIEDDLISKDSSHYTLRLLDENLSPVKSIKLRESNKLFIVEAATNDSSIAFLTGNSATHNSKLLIYDSTGVLTYSYTRPYVKHQGKSPYNVFSLHNSKTNKSLFNAGTHGYMVNYLVYRNLRNRTFELHYYDATANKQWKYAQPMQFRHWLEADYLAATDSVMLFDFTSSHRNRKVTSKITAFNFYTKKKAFDIDGSKQQFMVTPTSVLTQKDNDTLYVLGNYFKGNTNVWGRHSEGIGMVKIDEHGHVLGQSYSPWTKDIGPSLDLNEKGRSRKMGYLFLHEFLPGPDGKIYAVAEGYKRQLSPWGLVFSTVLLPFSCNINVTQVISTDLVLMEFNSSFKMARSTVYEKRGSIMDIGTDYKNMHRIGQVDKQFDSYGYLFTTITEDKKNFAICYTDRQKTDRHDMGSFHILRYNGVKFRNDEVRYKTDNGSVSIFPAKAGSLLFFENEWKKHKISMRLEKVS